MVCEERLWLALSVVNDPGCPLFFGGRLSAHGKGRGVWLKQLVVQTDFDSEFGPSWNRKNGRPALTELVEPNARCAGSVLPSAPTHSDLEAGHGLMEPEFAAVERSCGDVRVF